MTAFRNHLDKLANRISIALDGVLSGEPRKGEVTRPEQLLRAMRHGVLNGGKRLRPFLVIESAGLFGVGEEDALYPALALECIHCYSLIHDDLPSMDDDDLRRGQPTVHKAYDEATAILAGDGLLTLAFELIASSDCHPEPSIRCDLTVLLARAAGIGGMVGGQVLDLAAENRLPIEQEIRLLQAMKTGALIRFACEAGAVLGKAQPEERERLKQFGVLIGAAFQLADDILDVTASSREMGKQTGKDANQGKGTLVAAMGLEQARHEAAGLVKEAQELLSPYGEKADMLLQCAQYIVDRGR